MPYRRLPTTDKARQRAIDTAINIATKKTSSELAFSKSTLDELHNINSLFQNVFKQYKFDIKIQADKNKDYKASLETAKMYVSHFIQVLFLTNERGEINGGIKFYGELENFNGKVPVLNSEEEILKWGKVIIEGEQKRIQNGGSAIYNPSIALVKIIVENFKDTAIFQNNLKRNTQRSQQKMKELRKSANDFISRLWTEIEDNIQTGPPKIKRQLSQEYGIVYVFRRKEKKHLQSEELQQDLLFKFG